MTKCKKHRETALHRAKIFGAVCVVAMQFSVFDAFAYPNSFFNMREEFSSDVSYFPKWNGMVSRFEKQASVSDQECGTQTYHPCSVVNWKLFIQSMQGKPLLEEASRVNDYANAHPYIVDSLNWGIEDYWETPYEFLAVNGDCEDYAIAKYYSLRAIGVSSAKLRIMIVQDFNLGGIIHAILGVYTDEGLMILDNQIKQMVPALSIYHYKPIYGINEEGWWAYYPR